MALSGAAGFLNRGLLFLSTVALARLLGPEAMGLGSLAGLILGAVILTGSRGVPQSVVRMRDRDVHLLADTAFCLMLFFGVATALGFVLLAPAAAWAFNQARLATLLPVLGLAVLAFSVGRIPASVMDRELRQWQRFLPEVLGALAFLAVSLAFALLGYGVWSVIAGHLTYWSVWSGANLLLTPWRPAIRFSRAVAKEVLAFARALVVTGLATYGFRNLDNLAVARFIGASALGLYALAFNLASVPLLLAMPMGERALYPVFAAAQGDRQELVRLYRMTTRLLTAFGALAGAVIVALGPDIVRVVFGPLWIGAILPLQILSVQGALGTAVLPNVPLLTALNRRRELYPVVFSTLALLALLLYPASQYGIVAVAAVTCFAWVVGEIASVLIVARVLELSPLIFARDTARLTLGAALCVLPTVVLPNMLLGYASASALGVTRLLLQGTAAAGLYVLWLALTDRQTLHVYRQLRRLRQKARQANVAVQVEQPGISDVARAGL